MFRLRTFGGLTLEQDGVPHTGPATQRRRLALLALLAAADAGVSRERLMSHLWPESDAARARHSLDDALSAIRRDLRSDALFLGVATLRLNPEVLASDLAEHAAALRAGDPERAVTLYTGPFLDGFAVPDAADFERWMEAERGRRALEHARLLDALADAAAGRGDRDAGLGWRRARVAADPLDTPATLRLLTALADAGNPAEALRLARVHELLVQQELETTPGPEWAAAVERLRGNLAGPATRVTAVAPGDAAPLADDVTRPEPVGPPDVEPTLATYRAAAGEPSIQHAPTALPTPVTRPPDERSRRPARPRAALVLAGVLVAATLAAGSLAVVRSHAVARAPEAPQPVPVDVPRRVLVVPFENATGDEALAPLGRMAMDWVARGLAEVPGVAVTADLARPLQPGDADLRTVAANNGAGTVVSGAYYYDGDSIRFQLRVTETPGWVRRSGIQAVSASRASPTTLLEPLRQHVMAVLAVAHDPRYAAFAGGAAPPTYAAYEQYLAGTELFERGDWAGALPYYARAAAFDSSYVLPLIGAADGELNLSRPAAADSVVRGFAPRRASMTAADRGSLDRIRAELDGNTMAALDGARATALAAPGAQLPHFLHAAAALRAGLPREALTAAAPIASSFGRVRTPWTGGIYWNVVTAAYHLLGEHDGERAASHSARTYHPDSPDVLAYELRALAALGQLDSVRAGLRELEAMPASAGAGSSPALIMGVAKELEAHGHHADAQTALRQAVAAAHARAPKAQQGAAARWELARALYLLGDYGAALPLVSELVDEVPDDPEFLALRGLLAAHRGDAVEAARVDERLARLRRPYDRGQTTYARAQLAAARGAVPSALALLRQAMSEGFPYGTQLHVDPELAPLRRDPAFRALLAPRG